MTIGFPGLVLGLPCHRFVITSYGYHRLWVQTKTFGHAAVSGSEQHKRLMAHTGADEVLFAHNPKVTGSNPVPATKEALVRICFLPGLLPFSGGFYRVFYRGVPVEVRLRRGAGVMRRSYIRAASACMPGMTCL